MAIYNPYKPKPTSVVKINAVLTVTFYQRGDKTHLCLHTQFQANLAKRAATEAGYYGGWDSALDALTNYMTTLEEK